ncbi:MAG: metallophosphoesterase family protein [Thiobacillaceae bacterium]
MSSHPHISALALALGLSVAMPSALAASFSFGVMSDTQWKSNPDGENPGTVAVGIATQVQQQFINAKVDFVIQVGDLVDSYSGANKTVRAETANTLYDAGIGFFPLRGNHESSSSAANYVPMAFPQTSTGVFTRSDGTSFNLGSNFNSPFDNLSGLSYAFDYGNARFVLLDQFTRKDGTGSTNDNIVDQVPWIKQQLDGKGAANHGFVFAHKGLVQASHTDVLFGANPASNPAAQDAFMASLQENGVHYLFNGHDHNHQRSLITSPDGLSRLQNITTSSNSYKFYVPKTGSEINDLKYNDPPRETPIIQELFTVGYYIVNVDGPRVSVEHWASDNGCGGSLGAGVDCDLKVTPKLDFQWRETFGYSLNGKQFVVAPGVSFVGIQDTSPYSATHAAILDGVNAINPTIYDGRTTYQVVNTGWTDKAEVGGNLVSDVLSLWGMHNVVGSSETDVYALSMSFDAKWLGLDDLAAGKVALMTRDNAGKWVNAVDLNFGGVKVFVLGAYDSAYSLGTYGVDPTSSTAWAVLNHGSDFAVAAVPEPETWVMLLAGLGLVGLMARRCGGTKPPLATS